MKVRFTRESILKAFKSEAYFRSIYGDINNDRYKEYKSIVQNCEFEFIKGSNHFTAVDYTKSEPKHYVVIVKTNIIYQREISEVAPSIAFEIYPIVNSKIGELICQFTTADVSIELEKEED